MGNIDYGISDMEIMLEEVIERVYKGCTLVLLDLLVDSND